MLTIIVRNQHELIHSWPDASGDVSYLKFPHRHMLHIETEIEVTHDDRELEFITVQREISSLLANYKFPINISCEQIATLICDFIAKKYGKNRYITCAVFEDNENGAKVYYKEN